MQGGAREGQRSSRKRDVHGDICPTEKGELALRHSDIARDANLASGDTRRKDDFSSDAHVEISRGAAAVDYLKTPVEHRHLPEPKAFGIRQIKVGGQSEGGVAVSRDYETSVDMDTSGGQTDTACLDHKAVDILGHAIPGSGVDEDIAIRLKSVGARRIIIINQRDDDAGLD